MLWLFLYQFVGCFLILLVKSQSDINLENDTHSVLRDINETEVIQLTTVSVIENHNDETSTIKIDYKNDEYSEDDELSDQNMKVILCSSDTVFYMYKIYRISLPIFVRFIFGLAVSVKKVKAVFTNPIGLAIILLSNFLIVPLVSD